jgi:hypothetical protein
MAAKNSNRTIDLGSLLTDGATGFTVRKRSTIGLIVHFFLLACMVILGTAFLVYYKSEEGCLLAVVVGLVFAIIAQNMEQLKRAKLSLEFMNALFSSALGKDHQFCCVVKKTGDIVFYNRAFQTLFPAFMAQSSRKLETLLSLYTIGQEHSDKLVTLMATNTSGTIPVTLREENGSTVISSTFVLEPIERPTGFFLLRGK